MKLILKQPVLCFSHTDLSAPKSVLLLHQSLCQYCSKCMKWSLSPFTWSQLSHLQRSPPLPPWLYSVSLLSALTFHWQCLWERKFYIICMIIWVMLILPIKAYASWRHGIFVSPPHCMLSIKYNPGYIVNYQWLFVGWLTEWTQCYSVSCKIRSKI